MPSTATGTPYTVYSATLPEGECHWAVADSHAGDTDLPAILYAHGSQGVADQFATLSAWQKLRDWLIDNGWAWIEGDGGATTGLYNWGNAESRAAYPAYLDHVEGILSIGQVVLLGRSMGGLVTAWLYAMSDIKDRFSGWINNSGVSTMFVGVSTLPSDAATRNSGFYFSTGTYPAYGVTTYAGLVTAAAGFAPESWAASVWAGKKILCCYGDADTTVPFVNRGAGPLRTIWAGLPAIDLTSVRPGGDHTGTNGSYLDTAAMIPFLYAVTGTEPPVTGPKTYVRVVGQPYTVIGGIKYAVGPKPKAVPPT